MDDAANCSTRQMMLCVAQWFLTFFYWRPNVSLWDSTRVPCLGKNDRSQLRQQLRRDVK